MKKLTGILVAVCLTAELIAGCGQKAAVPLQEPVKGDLLFRSGD